MKVRRLKTDCCGMKVGDIYVAVEEAGASYVKCQLPDGSWTSSHWTDCNSDDPWFERVEDELSKGDN